MSWLFSRALVEAYSGDISSAGGRCAEWNVMPSPQGFWRNDRMIDASRLSQFGPTCAVLTVAAGEAVLTSFLADFPAKISASQEAETGSTGCARDCGASSPGSLARFDPITCSLKTHQRLLLEEGFESLEILPPWGTIAAGELFQRPTPYGLSAVRALITSVSGSGLPARSPTPTAGDAKSSGSRNLEGSKAHAGVSLTDFVKTGNSSTPRRVPTPIAQDSKTGLPGAGHLARGGRHSSLSVVVRVPTPVATEVEKNLENYLTKRALPRSQKGGSHGPNLATAVKLMTRRMPPPTVQDSSNNGAPSQMQRNTKPLNAEVGGPLNPTWVEWLMGWPIGWTDLNAPATDKFQQWSVSHGEY